MKRSSVLFFVLAAVALASCSRDIPREWQKDWSEIPAEYRPLKIIMSQMGVTRNGELRGRDYLSYLRDSCGVGGVVLSYTGKDYLKDEGEWALLADGVRLAVEGGLRVWFYDEDGYPSLSAGGRVLEVDPSLEALELVYDESKTEGERYYVRESYEYTHACNNYAAQRRYPDPGNEQAVRTFIKVTHQALRDHLGDGLFSHIEAFFTDEPSYLGVNLGLIPEVARSNVLMQDRPDPDKKLLPMLPWTKGIDADYKERYGEELPVESLFGGDGEGDKVVRQRYWELMGEHFRSNYCDIIEKWCANAGTLSSGHFLSEQTIVRHTPLYGNMLLTQRGLDIPGLDMLNTDPTVWNREGWIHAAFPESAAYLDGKRRVFTEISDHEQTLYGGGPATVEAMKGTATCQMAGGVTEFNLFYGDNYAPAFPYRSSAEYKDYCEFVGRINSIVREAEIVKDVLLYYPAYDLQREFLPEKEPLMDERNQSSVMKTVIGSFRDAGRALTQAQIPFVFADYLVLQDASVKDGRIIIGSHSFDALVLPEAIVLPEKVDALVESFRSSGGTVVNASTGINPQDVLNEISCIERFAPSDPMLVYGKFSRKGRDIYLVLNSSDKRYEGAMGVSADGRWSVLDPDSGEISHIETIACDGGHSLPVVLEPLQTLLYVSR